MSLACHDDREERPCSCCSYVCFYDDHDHDIYDHTLLPLRLSSNLHHVHHFGMIAECDGRWSGNTSRGKAAESPFFFF